MSDCADTPMPAPPPREAIPPGRVSVKADPHQITALGWVVRILLALGVAGAVVPGRAGDIIADAAVALLIITPLARVMWLAFRWRREADRRFMLAAIALLVVAITGGVLSVLGIGR